MGHRLLVTAATLLLAAAPAAALQLQLDRPTLCSLSDRVVVGEVTSDETFWTEDGGIARRAWVAVQRDLRGDGEDTAELYLPGGEIGEFEHHVEDVPHLDIDGRYLLFLTDNPDGSYTVIGGHQGAVRVAHSAGGPGEAFLSVLASVGRCNDA